MFIKEINKSFEEKYIKVNCGVPAFNAFDWQQNVHGQNLKVYGVFEEDEQLIGAFHLHISKKMGFTFIRTPHYMPTIGLVYDNRTQNEANSLSFNKKVIEKICEFIEALPYGVISIALPPFIIDTQPFFWKKFKVIPNYTYQLNLSLTKEEIDALITQGKIGDCGGKEYIYKNLHIAIGEVNKKSKTQIRVWTNGDDGISGTFDDVIYPYEENADVTDL